uniref:Uncharacterized LOC115552295 n=1 Tax=Gadus morhua TaxID=8049 RepID=A0A8C5C2R9_GADMO
MVSFKSKSFIRARTALVQLQCQNVTMYFAMIILSTARLIQAKESPPLVFVVSAGLGDTVTLHCESENEVCSTLYWYKQSPGCFPEMVASKLYESITLKPHINLTLTEGEDGVCVFHLIIPNVTKGDEANYFCQSYSRLKWNNFTFLSVKDPNDQRFVSQTVVQQPVTASVQLGDPVALQCSITSQRTDHSNQCQREPSVYWFRSGPSHPAAIYMNGNRSGECQNSSGPPSASQSCIYTLPKNNVNTSDAGTYYCALAACGEVVFGSGTRLEVTETNWRLVTMVLGILLACCLAVIIILFLTRKTKYLCDHREGTLSASNQVPHDSGNQEQQDGETDSLNYAALEFSGRKTRGRMKNSGRIQESLYSAVRETCH